MIERLITQTGAKCIAVGETGLDYTVKDPDHFL